MEYMAKDCPYCGDPLTTRDTTALGGDETFEWCETCGRIINEIDMEAIDVN
jgi:predicted RNA-binding Zn-ribbon protein involved in translation (DUF1610 family)